MSEANVEIARKGKDAFRRGDWDACAALADRLRWIIRGGSSGVEGEQRLSEIATFREGRIVFIECFLDHEQALNAVGLVV
jgi:hypothetical protein